MSFFRPAAASGLRNTNLAKLCKKCNDKEDDIEDEEKDAIGPTQVEAAEWNDDKGQDQRQTQRSCKNPCQQTFWFNLRRNKNKGLLSS